MKTIKINGAKLAYEFRGSGEIPLVMVHGGMLSGLNWNWVVPHLEDQFRILIYDRRGHGNSERPDGEVNIHKHVADLAALIEEFKLAPAWVAGQSSGSNIILRLASGRPDLFRGIITHEPALLSLIADDPAKTPMLEGFGQLHAAVVEQIASGDHSGAARLFVESGLGKGLWAKFPPEFRQNVIDNVPGFYDDSRDPDDLTFDLEWIKGFNRPALMTLGDETAPVFPMVIDKLVEVMPSAEVRNFTGAGHVIQAELPEKFAEAITSFVHRHAA